MKMLIYILSILLEVRKFFQRKTTKPSSYKMCDSLTHTKTCYTEKYIATHKKEEILFFFFLLKSYNKFGRKTMKLDK